MAKITGGRINLGVAREAARGTCLLPTFWIPWTTIDFEDKVTSINSAEALGVICDSHEKHNVEKYGQGSIEGEVRDDSFGLYLYALMGTLTGSVAVVASSYDHTFNIANTNQHTSLTLTTEDPNGDRQWCLAMINTMELNVVLGEYVKYNIEFISRHSHPTAADHDIGSFGVEHKFRCIDAYILLAANRAAVDVLDKTDRVKIQSLRLTFNKNILRKHMTGTIEMDDAINQAFSVEGEFTLPYEDQVYRALMNLNTYQAMKIVIENQEVALADGAAIHPSITINLPRCGFYDWTPDRPVGELAEQTIGFKGYRDHANDEDCVYSIVLRNDTITY